MAMLYGRQWTQAELTRYVGQIDQIGGIKAIEAADGTERGVRIFEVWTGTGLFFHVLTDRALDISVCRYKDRPLAWRSSSGDVHPAFYEPQGRGWLRSFPGGLLATCGLDHFGPPLETPDESLGQHGRISNLPAKQVGYRTYWNGDDYEMEIMGETRQTRLFGENLVLRRHISTRLGSNQIRISDTVTNEGFNRSPHMILYHFNLGFPLLSPDSLLLLETEQTLARDITAEPGLSSWNTFQTPTPSYQEQVFYHAPKTDANGNVHIELKNPRLGVGVRFQYAKAQLPALVQWKQMGEGAYALGIEPTNVTELGGNAVPDRSELPQLAPGESRSYNITLEVVEYGT